MIIKQVPELIKDNLIAKHYAGSKAYGTNIATSDLDFRGIFVADPVNIRTPFFRVDEAKDTTEEDTVIYELTHYMKLALDNNPNVLETLFVDESDIVFDSPAYQHLRNHRQQFLSTKIAHTTTGYAYAQLNRIKRHSKHINNPQPEKPPRQSKYVSLVHNFTDKKLLKFNLEDYYEGYRLVPYSHNTYGLYESKTFTTFNKDTGNLNTVFEGDTHTYGTPLFVVKFNLEQYDCDKNTWSKYWEWKRNRNPVRSEMEHKFGFDCYSDDTEFLTEFGWKRFDDISETELLATFNPKTFVVEYQPYIERFDSVYTGNMYNIRGQHTDVNVTANHKMFVRCYSRTTKKLGDWEFVEAARLYETFDSLHTIKPRLNRQKLPDDFNEGILTHVTMLNYLRIMGWYISDGTCIIRENSVNISISQSKPQSTLTKSINRLRNSGNINCSESIYPPKRIANYPEHKWLFDSVISTWIYTDCGHGSKYKRIPNWVFQLTKREMTTLLIALIQGDGTQKHHQRKTFVYYTISNELADDVQRLAFLCGYETAKWGPYELNSTFDSNNSMYQVYINMNNKPTKRHTRNQTVYKTSVDNQRIVCFMVKNHTLVTRRDGKIALHGNCKHAMHVVRLLNTGVEVLTTGEYHVKRPDAELLLDIRSGKWTYEELIEYAEEKNNYVKDVLYKTSNLPKAPDIKLAAKVLMEVQDMVWRTNG